MGNHNKLNFSKLMSELRLKNIHRRYIEEYIEEELWLMAPHSLSDALEDIRRQFYADIDRLKDSKPMELYYRRNFSNVYAIGYPPVLRGRSSIFYALDDEVKNVFSDNGICVYSYKLDNNYFYITLGLDKNNVGSGEITTN